MKTVIIPNDYHPFVIEVNGVKYTYPEGTEQSVPDEVAAAIEHYYKLQPKERPADGGVLPWVSDEDEGEVLMVEDGVWKKASGGLKKADLYFRTTGQFDGVIADGKVEYFPATAVTSTEVQKISNEAAYAAVNPHIFGRENTASGTSVEAKYAKEPLRYELAAASVLSLLTTGQASETVTIQNGAPNLLWDSIIVSMGTNELLCRRITAANQNNGIYQGFLRYFGDDTMQDGLYAAVVSITRDNRDYFFDFSFSPVSTGGGSNELYAHRITFSYSGKSYKGTLITDDSTPFIKDTLLDYINEHGISGSFGKKTLYTTDLLTDLDIINSTADNLSYAISFICKPVSEVNKFFANRRILTFTVNDNAVVITRTMTEAEVTFESDDVMSLNASKRTY